jgi:hypothetical protein
LERQRFHSTVVAVDVRRRPRIRADGLPRNVSRGCPPECNHVDAGLLGPSAKLGTLEAGMLADVIAGNPLEEIHVTERVLFVMKEGVVLKRPPR